MMERDGRVVVDVDWDRVRTIVQEATRMIHEYVEGEYTKTSEEIMQQLEKIIATNKITTQFFINVGCKKIPDLLLRVDPVDKKVLCKSLFTKKAAAINHFLRVL